MSTENSRQDKPADEPEVEKEVTVMGYPNTDEIGDYEWKRLASLVMSDTDWYEQTVRTSESHFLVFNDEQSDRVEVASKTQANEVAARRKDVYVETETDADEYDAHSRFDAGREFRDALMDELPDEVSGLEKSGRQYKRNGACVCSISASLSSSERVLKRREDRTEDDGYEDGGPTTAISVTFSIGPAPQTEVQKWSEDIIEVASTTLGRWDGIQKVRVAECTVSKQGDCFV